MRTVHSALLGAAAVIALGASAFAQGAGGPVVATGSGQVRGFAEGDVENFFGIPYAAAPEGALRWKAPEPAAKWDDVRDATAYGPACPQEAGLDSVRTTDEDCLFVNVQRPQGTADDAKLPVVVVIHGGGWMSGSGNNENLNAMVREGGVVGVTMNYRMGNLGNLSHPALADEKGNVGNYGLLDQQAALRWVRDNIARFGGDPARVTIGGESAGGGSTCQLMAAPSSQGLYTQAFMMSTLCNAVPKVDAEAAGQKIAADLGCEGADAAACLRDLSVDKLIDAKGAANRPVSGTDFLPKSGWQLLEEGAFPKVPMLIGATRNEGRSFLTDWESRSVRTFDKQAYEAFAREQFGDDADAVLSVYPWPADPTRYSGTYLVAEIMMAKFTPAGGLSACKTNQITEKLVAQGSPVFAYEFGPDGGPGWFEVPGYVWGAGHAVELAYLIPDRGNFANNGKALSADHRTLADAMLAHWGAFVRTGDPRAEGTADWPQYKAGSGPVMMLREGDRSAALPAVALRSAHHCDLWESLD